MSTVVIRLDGTNITSQVVLSDAIFTQQANGQPGSCHFRLRDLGHDFTPRAGLPLTVDVDGIRVWGGWAMRVSPGYFFSVDDTSDPLLTERLWTIEGVDYNILFSKRFLINKNNPVKMIPNYPAGTHDDVIVLDVINKFLELGGDGISTAGVTHVGTPNPDDTGNVGNPGDSWGQAMSIISQPTQAVFYIDPNKVLQYVDVETASAPFALTDTPNHTTSFGYRDMEVTFDGVNLVNDSMVWGAAPHSTPDITFKRIEDAASIAEHGRWQRGEFSTALYTSSGVNHRARTFVYGSPQSKRGGKDDSVQVMCTTFTPGLVAGQVVSFTSSTFGYSDVLPIRRMAIRFPTPTDVSFQLNLSYDIDSPWSDYEFWFPKTNFNPPRIVLPPGVKFPPIVDPPPGGDGDGCSDEVCGVTDYFDRPNANEWGVSDAGITWETSGTVEISGNQGVLIGDSPGGHYEATASLEFPPTSTMDVTVQVQSVSKTFDPGVVNSGVSMEYLWFFIGDSYLEIGRDQSTGNALYIYVSSDTGDELTAYPAINETTEFYLRAVSSGSGSLQIYLWQASGAQPTTPTLVVSNNVNPEGNAATRFEIGLAQQDLPSAPAPIFAVIGMVDIKGVNRCGATQFDDFQRMVTSGWGIATPSGFIWSPILIEGSWNVGASGGIMIVPNGSVFTKIDSARTGTSLSAPWMILDGWTLRLRFTMYSASASFMTIGIHDSVSNTYSMFGRLDYGSQILRDQDGNSVPMSLVLGTSYILELFVSWGTNTDGSGKTWKVRAWDEQGATPDWMIQGSGGTAYPNANAALFVNVNNSSVPTATALFSSIDFDYADKPCYPDPCTVTEFENFNRTVSTGWGVSTSGQPWQVLGSGTSSVNGSVGIATNYSWHYQDYAEQPDFLKLPIEIEVLFTANHSGVGGGVGVNGEIDFYGNNDAGIPFVYWAGPLDAYIWYAAGSSFGDDNMLTPSATYSGSVDATQPIHFKMTVEAGRGGIKAWNDGDPEPADYEWTNFISDFTSVPFTVADDFGSLGLGPEHSHEWQIDYINFGGIQCDCVSADDFTRSVTSAVTPASTTGTLGTGPLGQWVRVDDSFPPSTSWASIGVDGSAGVIAYGGGASPAPGRFSAHRLFVPLSLPLELIADISWAGTNFAHITRFEIVDGVDSNFDNGVSVELHNGSNNISVGYSLTTAGGGTGGGSGGSFNVLFGPVVAGVYYRIRFRVDTSLSAKVWRRDDAEPADWTTTFPISTGDQAILAAFMPTASVLYEQFANTGGPSKIDYFSIGTECSAAPTSGDGDGGPSSSPRGSVCESFSGGTRTFTVSQAYVPNTTKVYIDGLHQQLGLDYVENPVSGIVQFVTPPPSGSTVTVCFYASLG